MFSAARLISLERGFRGEGITEAPNRAQRWKRRIQTRSFLRITAPALDPTRPGIACNWRKWITSLERTQFREPGVLGQRVHFGFPGEDRFPPNLSGQYITLL